MPTIKQIASMYFNSPEELFNIIYGKSAVAPQHYPSYYLPEFDKYLGKGFLKLLLTLDSDNEKRLNEFMSK